MSQESLQIVLTEEVLQIQELSLTEKVMLCLIRVEDTGEGCTRSNGFLAKVLQMSPSRVSEIIKTLAEKNHLTIQLEKGAGNERTLFGKPNSYSENRIGYSENRIGKDDFSETTLYRENIIDDNNKGYSENRIGYSENRIGGISESPTLEVEQKIEKEKLPPSPPKKKKAHSANEHTFAEDELYDLEKFTEYINAQHPTIDTNYYYWQVSTWLDKETGQPPRRKVWKSVILTFLKNDYIKGNLKLKGQNNDKGTHNNKARSISNNDLDAMFSELYQ
jgi:hypothetical protein